jgi:hypothetical protein
MRGSWTGLGLLLVVPWLTQCTTGRLIRLETGEGPPLVYTPASPEPPPIEIPQQVFFDTLTDLLLTAPLTIYPPRQGQVIWASWGATPDTAQQLLLDQCEPSESADDCLRLPSSAPPPGTLSRMRLAFSLSLDSLWEGATIPMAEYADPLAFKVMVYSAMITWLVILMAPEPVTKALAALLTLCLVAYIGLGPVWSMMKASWQFAQDCERATTAEQLKLAGQRFNLVLGDNGMRIFLLLATAAIGGRASFLDKGPRLPAFSRAAAHASKRTGVNLRAMAQVRTVALAEHELVIGLAPTAVAAVAMGPGGAGGPRTQSTSGQSTGDTLNVRPPAARHYAKQVDQRTVAKDVNSVLEPHINVEADIKAIRAGQAQAGRAPGGEFSYSVNGRTYGMHTNGTLYPVEGVGVHTLDRASFKALGVFNQFGDTPRATQILDKMGIGVAERARALDVWKTYQ